MILGAGIYQVPLIKKANELGLETIVISKTGNYPGFSIAKKSYFIDTTEKEKILEIAKIEKIDGVCTAGTDVAIPSIGYVCDNLSLPGISFKHSLVASNKKLMKDCFIKNSVNTSKFITAYNAKDLREGFEKLKTKKAIVKVVDKSGSRGIVCVEENTNFEDIYNNLIKLTNEEYLIIEDYIDGKEIGIDVFILDSSIYLLIPHDKLTYEINDVGIPIGHMVPYECNDIVKNNIIREVNKIIKAYGIINGAINIDAFVMENNEINIIEAGARSGATGIPEIISVNTGINYYELIINAALGNKIDKKKTKNIPCSSVLLFSTKDGLFNGLDFTNKDNIVISTDYEIGTPIKKIVDGTCRIGQAIITASNKKDLIEETNNFINNIKVKII